MSKSLLFVAYLVLNLIAFSQAGHIYTLASNGVSGYYGDGGPATSAELATPQGVAVSSNGNVYIADAANNRVRVVSADGVITTFAGGGSSGLGDGGPATAAQLSNPDGIAFSPSGDSYISDWAHNSIRIVFANGTIDTYAGNGSAGYSGDGGPAINAELNGVNGVAISPTGELYIADYSNNCIRVVFTNGTIATYAGNGTAGYSGDGGDATSAMLYHPRAVATSSTGEIYIADAHENRVRVVFSNGIIATLAGNGSAGYSGDGGPATNAELYQPFGVAVSSNGIVYIADEDNNRVRYVISTCYGKNQTSSSVCSGHGTCQFSDSCSCDNGYTGYDCEL